MARNEYLGVKKLNSPPSTEDRELMQLKTVLEGHPHVWTPLFGHLTVHSSPRVMLVHLTANAISSGLRITKQEVNQLLVRLGDCLVVSLMGFLEHLLGLLNLHLAGLNINICWDSVPWPSGFKEILQCLGLSHYSLSNLPTLCVQPLLLDDAEDCNNVHMVFLGVPMGVNGHVEVGIVWKFGLQDLWFLLGSHNIHLSNIQDGRPVAQLPFLALRILQPVGRLEGSTHFWRTTRVRYWAQVSWKKTLAGIVGTQLLEWWLKKLHSAKLFWFQKKNSRVCQLCTYNRLDGLVQKKMAFAKCTAWQEQGFEFKVSYALSVVGGL